MWKKSFYLLIGVVTLIGCVFHSQATIPDWVMTPHTAYPSDQYLVGMGEGSSWDQAEQRAYAAVARIFSANVQATSSDQESYSLHESNSKSSQKREVQLDHMTQVTTSKLLNNVKIIESWHRKNDQRFFALAGLDRGKAEKVLKERLRTMDERIMGSVKEGRTHAKKLSRVHGYKRALALLRERESVNADLRVIGRDGDGLSPPVRRLQLEGEFRDFVANHLSISVMIEGEYRKEIERGIWDGLEKEGLLSSTRNPDIPQQDSSVDVVISGKGQLWTIDLPDPLFRYVRWCGDLQIRESETNQLIGVISRSGREGHITEKEARIRASNTLQHILSEQVAHVLTHSVFNDEPDFSEATQVRKSCPQ